MKEEFPMRTLKKALSLVLVLAMVFALAVPGFAAVTKGNDYSDYSTVTNKEAVDVLTAIGVIHGNTDGSFGPTGNFTRAQAATMITYMMLGTTVADALSAGATQFNDVPATHWAAKYVQYCANEGIINGYGDGKFGPDDKLTNAQWALMLLGALGYKAQNEQIGGAGWEIKTTSLAIQAGVASPEDMTGSFNRDIAAKMAFNTLTSDLVEYASNGVTINGTDLNVYVGASKANKIAQGNVANTMKADYLQFAERHFPKLVLDNSAVDGMGRTCNKWTLTNQTDAIGTYAKAANHTAYVTSTNNTLQKVLNSVNKQFNTSAVTTVNGNVGNVALSASLNRGDQVEIYTDKDNANKVTNIVVTRYTVSKLTADPTTRTSGDNTLVRLPGVAGLSAFSASNTTKTVIGYNGLKSGDIVLSYKDNNNVYRVEKAESFDGILTAYTGTTLTVGGTRYSISEATGVMDASKLQELHRASATWYLDKAGNIVYAEGTAVTQLAYVLDAKAMDGGWNNTYRAKIVDLATGNVSDVVTEKNYSATGDNMIGNFVRFSVKDDVYTLSKTGAYASETAGQTAAATGATVTITKGNPTIKLAATGADVLTNSATIFLIRNYKSNTEAQDSFSAYTGYTAVPSFTGTVATGKVSAVVYRGTNGYAQYVVIDPNSMVSGTTSANDMFYVVSSTVTTHVDADGTTGYSVRALKINSSEIEDLVFNSVPTVVAGKAYIATVYNDKSQIVSFTNASGDQYITGTGTGFTVSGTLSLNNVAYGYNDDTVVFYLNKDNELSVGDAATLQTDDNDVFVAVRAGKTASDNGFYTLRAIFVKEVEDVIAPVNAAAPTATKKADIVSANTTDSNTFEVVASSTDGGQLTYAWSIQKDSDAATTDSSTASTMAKTFAEAGTYKVTCTVTNTLSSATGNKTATAVVEWTVTVA